jgi:hypothetical protein
VDIFATRPKTRRKSWWSLLLVIPLFYQVFIFASRSHRESDAAGRQEISSGTVIECRPVKGGYFCDYIFPVDGKHYKGASHWDSDLMYGQTVDVSYDSDDPRMNTIGSFAEQARSDWTFACVWLLLVIGLAVGVVYTRVSDREASG